MPRTSTPADPHPPDSRGPLTSPGATVWAYIRVSSEQQADKGLPVEGQRQAIQKFCRERGYTVSRFYIDEAVSGGTDRREQFQLMLRDAERERPAALVMWSWSRFSRNQNDAMFHKANLRRHGIEILTVEEDIPQIEGFNTILEALIHWKDEQYLRGLSESSRRGQQALARMGYVPAGGPPPYGYTVEMTEAEVGGKRRTLRRWVLHPETSKIAREAWDMKLSGASNRDIWKALGMYRHHTTLSTFFSNPIYKGELPFGETIIPVPAIVTPQEWDRVQTERPESPAGAYANRKRSQYLLSGMAKCGLCGATLNGYSVVTKGARYHYYTCNRHKARRSCAFGRVRADALEAAVIEGIFGEILTVANLEAQMEQMQEELDRDLPLAQARVRLLEAKLQENEQAIGKLVEAVEAGAGSSALYTRLREREEERDHLREELDRAKHRNRPQRLQLDQVQELRRQLREAFDSGPPQLVRELLKAFVLDITVTKEALRVRYHLPFL